MKRTPKLDEHVRRQLKAFRRGLRGIDEGDVESLHRTRIASRRLRELLPLFNIPDDERRTLIRRFRKVTRRLGKVRQLDVLGALVHDLERSGRYSMSALGKVQGTVGAAREAARSTLGGKMSAARLERLASKVKRAVRDAEPAAVAPRPRVRRPHKTSTWALEARQVRRATSLRSAIRSAGTIYSAEPLHGVRVAIKKLRYALELSEGQPGLKSRLATLKRAQDVLGRLHDLEVLVAWIRTTQAALAPPNLSEWRELSRLIRALEKECRRLHAGYLARRDALCAIVDAVRPRQRASAGERRQAAG